MENLLGNQNENQPEIGREADCGKDPLSNEFTAHEYNGDPFKGRNR